MDPHRSIVSLPVQRGLGGASAVDLYFVDPRPLVSATFLADAWAVVDTIGEAMTQGWGTGQANNEPAWLNGEPARMRARVWTAIGMVNVALKLNTPQALDRLRGYAYSHASTIDALADSLTRRRIDTAALNA